jgi:hypothetical protein
MKNQPINPIHIFLNIGEDTFATRIAFSPVYHTRPGATMFVVELPDGQLDSHNYFCLHGKVQFDDFSNFVTVDAGENEHLLKVYRASGRE